MSVPTATILITGTPTFNSSRLVRGTLHEILTRWYDSAPINPFLRAIIPSPETQQYLNADVLNVLAPIGQDYKETLDYTWITPTLLTTQNPSIVVFYLDQALSSYSDLGHLYVTSKRSREDRLTYAISSHGQMTLHRGLAIVGRYGMDGGELVQ